MGWGNCGKDSLGRNIGYYWRGKCDHRGCKTRISRSVSSACGGMHGEADEYCEKYFCDTHLSYVEDPFEQRIYQGGLCEKCKTSWNEQLIEDLIDDKKAVQEELISAVWKLIDWFPCEELGEGDLRGVCEEAEHLRLVISKHTVAHE